MGLQQHRGLHCPVWTGHQPSESQLFLRSGSGVRDVPGRLHPEQTEVPERKQQVEKDPHPVLPFLTLPADTAAWCSPKCVFCKDEDIFQVGMRLK